MDIYKTIPTVLFISTGFQHVYKSLKRRGWIFYTHSMHQVILDEYPLKRYFFPVKLGIILYLSKFVD